MTKLLSLKLAKKHKLPVPSFFEIDFDVADDKIPEAISKGLQDANLNDCDLFAVRSSADVEDSAIKSYAGQFDTELFVKKVNLVQAVIECRKSANLDNFKNYDGSIKNTKMNVVIQKMIKARLSGVVFSANPNGMLNEAVISISSGAGTAVEGTELTTTYYYHFDDDLYVEDIDSNGPKLQSDEFHSVVGLLRRAKQLFGKYIDMEFAIDEAGLWLLQVRPITTISDRDIVVFDNHNISESYPGVSLPLTQSFACLAYSEIFEHLLQRMIGKRSARRYKNIFSSMVRSLNGHMYYQVSSWYAVLDLMPFRKRLLSVWQDMVGVDIKLIQKNIQSKASDRLRMLFSSVFLNLTLSRKMTKLHQEFERISTDFERKLILKPDLSEILRIFNWLQKSIFMNWDITLINDMDAFIYTSIYNRFSANNKSPNGDKMLPSAQVIIEFSRLSKQLHTSDDFEKVSKMNHDEISSYINSRTTSLATSLANYINQYGDRVPGELKLETITFRTNPELLIKQLVNNKVHKLSSKTRSNHGLFMRLMSKRTARGIYFREQSRLDRSRIFGMARTLVLLAGEDLKQQGYLDDARDIFYLKLDEIKKHKSLKISYKKIIFSRKNEYSDIEKLPSYSRMVFPRNGIVERWSGSVRSSFDNSHSVFHGIACSAGKIEGEALVMTNLSTTGDVTGKILIAETTDPGWVLLVSRASGIIVEKGSLLSHTAIISRELHLPSVVGVSNATKIIKSGDKIRMNGLTGEVEIL